MNESMYFQLMYINKFATLQVCNNDWYTAHGHWTVQLWPDLLTWLKCQIVNFLSWLYIDLDNTMDLIVDSYSVNEIFVIPGEYLLNLVPTLSILAIKHL